MGRIRLLKLVFVFAAICAMVSIARAAGADSVYCPMADRVPADAVAYFGWAGSESQAKAYTISDLAAFWDHSNLPQVAAEYLPKLWDKLAGQIDEIQAMAALQKAAPLMLRHPLAIYVSNVTISPDGTPNADVAMICDAGADASELQADLQSAIADVSHLHVVSSGSSVIVAIDESTKRVSKSTLASAPAFIAAMGALQKSPAVAIYVDGKALCKSADESAQKDENAKEIWPAVRDALGIGGLKTFAMTMGFDGSSWMTSSALQAPMPRTGLLSVIEPKPIDPVLLSHIPPTAGSVSVVNFDVVKLYDTIGAAMAANPDADKTFHQASGLATIALGRNFRQQILAPLGPQWVMYSDAKLHSVIVLNHPSDADAAADSLVSATFGLVNLANSQISGASKQPVVNAEQTNVKGIDLTSAVTKWVSPTFAVKEGILYLGLSEQSVVASATTPAATATKDFLHTDDFISSVQRLGIPGFTSFDYSDLPRTAPEAYENFGAAGEQIKKVMDAFGIDMPKVDLPQLDQIKSHLSSALAVSWADADGIYSKSISPFPLSGCLLGNPQQSMTALGTVAAAAEVVVPSVQKARAAATLVKTASNQRQILLGLMMYATSHHGVYPPDLGTLILDGQLKPDSLHVFLQAGSKVKIPPEIANGTKDQQAAWVNDKCEYEFLLPGKKLAEVQHPSQTPVIVPKDAALATTRVNIGFADGHVETLKPERALHLLHPDDAPENP